MFKKLALVLILFIAFGAVSLNTPAFALSPLHVAVDTDKALYHLRENVNVFGNVTLNDALVNQGFAGIQIESPSGTLAVRTRPVGPIGSQTLLLQIFQVTLSDYYGNPRQTVVRPSITPPPATYVTIRVKNNGGFPRPVLITGTIYDNDSIPMTTVSFGTEISGYGWVNLTQQVGIEPWAKNGTATIYANVFTDLPENNGYPLCPEKAATFAILESEFDESLPKGVPQQTIQNGTYHTTFRLSSEPKPGVYIVYATALSAGFHPDVTTAASFQVVNIASPPRASFAIKPPGATINYDITFDAGSSTPEGYNETITNYKWSFGDTQTGTGKIVHHQYINYGNYTVTLNVTDSDPHGYWNTTTRKAVIKLIHNVAVLNMSSLNIVFNDWKASVGVTVKNRGTVPETFNVTLYVNVTHYAGRIRFNNLAAYVTNTTTITWDTTGYTALRNATLKTVADTIPGELTTTDNSASWGAVQIRLLGDLYFDRKIDVLDLVRVTGLYGLTSSDARWNIMADLFRDNKIDILDVVKITGRYGQRY